MQRGIKATEEGDFGAAHSCYGRSLVAFQQLGDKLHVVSLLFGFAQLAILQGRAERAVCLLGSFQQLLPPVSERRRSEELAYLPGPAQIDIIGAAQRMLGGDEAGQPAFDRGKAMKMAEAIEYAIADNPRARSPKYCEVQLKGFVAVALMSVIYEDSKSLIGLSVGHDGKRVVRTGTTRISMLRFPKAELDQVTPAN